MWDQIVAEVDKNQDGEISFDEFEEAMRNVLSLRASFYKMPESDNRPTSVNNLSTDV